MAAVQNYLAEIKHKWIDVGIQLELDPVKLEQLGAKERSSDGDNLRRMLLDWLLGDDPLPSWSALCFALRTPAVNEIRIASVIEREQVFVDLSSESGIN